MKSYHASHALLADIVLHLAGIFQCNLCRNSKSLQHLGKYGVSLIDLVGDLCALLQKCHSTVTVHGNISVLTEKLHRMADTWLGNAKSGSNINGTNPAALLR